jgi:hypothetical protein
MSGALFTAVGIGFAVGATNYPAGTAAEMDAGYFPFLLGIFLSIIGVAITVTSLHGNEQPDSRIGQWGLKPMFFIILADVLFGVLLGGLPSIGLPPMGLMISIVALVVVASRAGPEFAIKEVLVLAVILAIGSYFLFIKTLNLPFQVWPEFVGG